MADGHINADTIGVTELAARLLQASASTGSTLASKAWEIPVASADGNALGIAWQGGREESAARSIGGGTRAAALHGWTRNGGTMSLPHFRRDTMPMLAMAAVDAVPAALLRLYALEDMRGWPLIERAALVCITGKGAREAVHDAMARILWRVAAASKADRARELHMRGYKFLQLTNRAERLLRRWLGMGARQLLDAHRELQRHRRGNPLLQDCKGGRSDPCGLRRETWWHPERLTPRGSHKE